MDTTSSEQPGLPPAPPGRLTIAIAGATGFVGHALRRALSPAHRVIGLTRSHTLAEHPPTDGGVEWRPCDLFSLRDLEASLEGVDCAIYLVHSMLPSARLTQSNFSDLDLVLADNFARAAERCGVRQILYVGGLIPDEGELSPHLESRLEVERTLGSRATPLTALRAGLIVGAGGSSLSILINLVRRLPMMILPRWTASRTQPIAIADVVRAVQRCLGNEATFGRRYDVGGPEVLTYRSMMQRAAKVLGVRRFMLPVPYFSPRFSRLWVTLFSGASSALVGPLIESLRHEMVALDNPLQRELAVDAVPFDQALEASLEPTGKLQPNPRVALVPQDRAFLRRARTVRSVQRMELPPGRDARWVAGEYVRFLPRFVKPLLRCEVVGHEARLYLNFTNLLLMQLDAAPERSTSDRQILDVAGGALVADGIETNGRLEFREILGRRYLLAAVHDFTPALPWHVYHFTQAYVHLWVMKGFARHLSRSGEKPALPALEA